VEVFPLPEMRTQSQSPLAHRGQAALRQKLQWPEHLASHQMGFRASWLELMHLRERVTNADRVLEDEIREMLIAPPRIEFLIAAERGDEARHRRAEPAGA
jgi:hypothetical protein